MTAIVNEITGRDLRDLFAPMYNDQRRRRLLRKKPDVIDLCGRPRSQALIAKLSELRIQNPGVPSYVTDAFDDIADTPTVTLFLAKQGSDALSYVGEAVQDESRAMALQERFFQEVAPRAPMTMAQAIAELVEQPVYAEVLYADLRLGDHLYVPPGMELIAFVFPYDGGKLNPEGFTLLQWSSTGEQLEALVVHNAPPSTDAEREARRAHPGLSCHKPGPVRRLGGASLALLRCSPLVPLQQPVLIPAHSRSLTSVTTPSNGLAVTPRLAT